jgi:hypothetical protein
MNFLKAMAVYFDPKKNHPLSSLPQNGRPGQGPINMDASQNWTRPLRALGKPWMPPLIGHVEGLLPQQTGWVIDQSSMATLPSAFYYGGDDINIQGGMSFGNGGINGLFKIKG